MNYSPIKVALFVSVLTVMSACKKDDGAQQLLNSARESYRSKDYIVANQLIGSIGKQYPKAFEEIKAGMMLLDSVRRGENEVKIKLCDSLLVINNDKLEKLKREFVYKKDKEYDELGTYYPKKTFSNNMPTANTLKSGVNEKGQMHLESISLGGRKHHRLAIKAKDGAKVQTLDETSDGLNYSFQHSGVGYETIRFIEMTDNGVAKFIVDNIKQPMTVTLEGKNTDSYTLTELMKSGIINSYSLKELIVTRDSLNAEREKAMYKIEYLIQRKK